jgi:hypothetical protein
MIDGMPVKTFASIVLVTGILAGGCGDKPHGPHRREANAATMEPVVDPNPPSRVAPSGPGHASVADRPHRVRVRCRSSELELIVIQDGNEVSLGPGNVYFMRPRPFRLRFRGAVNEGAFRIVSDPNLLADLKRTRQPLLHADGQGAAWDYENPAVFDKAMPVHRSFRKRMKKVGCRAEQIDQWMDLFKKEGLENPAFAEFGLFPIVYGDLKPRKGQVPMVDFVVHRHKGNVKPLYQRKRLTLLLAILWPIGEGWNEMRYATCQWVFRK